MNLYNLVALTRRYWKLPIFTGLAFLLAGLCFAMISEREYQATAVITATDSSGTVTSGTLTSVVASFANGVSDEMGVNDKVNVKIETGTASQSISVTATESSEEDCISIANEVARRAADESISYYQAMEEEKQQRVVDGLAQIGEMTGGSLVDSYALSEITGPTFSFCRFEVREASSAVAAGKGVAAVAAATLGGLFVGFCLVVMRYFRRKVVCSRFDVEEVSEGPVMVLRPGCERDIDAIWSAISVGGGVPPALASLVSVGGCDVAPYARLLVDAAKKMGTGEASVASSQVIRDEGVPDGGVSIVSCPSLEMSSEALFVCSRATCSVVFVKRWVDSMMSLRGAMEQLALADADVTLLVLVDR